MVRISSVSRRISNEVINTISKLHIHPLIFKSKLHFSNESLLVMFFLGNGNYDVSFLHIIPLPFVKLCEVDERIRGQNLF
jgi:hypothetical protein